MLAGNGTSNFLEKEFKLEIVHVAELPSDGRYNHATLLGKKVKSYTNKGNEHKLIVIDCHV